jgi:asparagine N-glycosylation enzyme membrane subunit Stt3
MIMKRFIYIFLFPLCILSGIGLFQLIFKIFGESVSFGYQVLIGFLFGVIMWISEVKLFIIVSSKLLKNEE